MTQGILILVAFFFLAGLMFKQKISTFLALLILSICIPIIAGAPFADAKKNLVRAIATGATELRTKDMLREKLGDQELQAIAGESLGLSGDRVKAVAQVDEYLVFQARMEQSKLFGLVKRTTYPTRILHRDGVVRLQVENGTVITSSVARCRDDLALYMNKLTRYSEGGEKIPHIFLLSGSRLIDFSKLMNKEQVLSLQALELAGLEAEKPVVIIMS